MNAPICNQSEPAGFAAAYGSANFMKTKILMKPILACTLENLSDLIFPVIASPKIDGVRCFTLASSDGQNSCIPTTRNGLPVRNKHVYDSIALACVPGLDGELVASSESAVAVSFCENSSKLLTVNGTPEFTYWVFDFCSQWKDARWTKGIVTKYNDRLSQLYELELPSFVKIVPTLLVETREQFETFFEKCLSEGYEGVCARAPHSPYKFGRSTLREGWLYKYKLSSDAEATIVGFEELFHNSNSFLRGSRRHLYADGMVPMGILGSFRVRDELGREFSIGTGLTREMREDFWKRRESLFGRIVKYKFQKEGSKNVPRFPVFLGFRDSADLS